LALALAAWHSATKRLNRAVSFRQCRIMFSASSLAVKPSKAAWALRVRAVAVNTKIVRRLLSVLYIFVNV